MPGVEVSGDWREFELEEVDSGQTFKISDFAGKTIFLESFAVWCPTCLKQQKEMKKIVDENIVHISLDTDPNESAAIVRDHKTENDLDWYFAVAPIEMTQLLIDEFGNKIVNAPAAPVVLICKDQSYRLLKRGVKDADELREEIEEGCNE